MKSSAPWSVKGIKRDARETAKEAARRQGMTVGEWLSQVIYAAGDPETSDGEIEGIRTSDLVTAIEHLNKRVIAAESRGAEAMEDLARTIGAVLERLQRVERTRPPDAPDPVGGPAIEERLARLEAKAGDRQRIDALRALEKAVGQVALQYDTAHKSTLTRVESTERQLQELASRLDRSSAAAPDWIGGPSALGPLKETIDGLSRRLERAERIAAEATTIRTEAGESVDADFVERTGARLRILGDEIKRSGDQIRTLESLIRKLSDQIDAAERRSSEGVQKVAETISQLRSEFGQSEAQESGEARQEIEAAMAEVTRRTETRIAELQRAFESMIARLEAPPPQGDEVRPVGLPSPKRDRFAPDLIRGQAGKAAPTPAHGAGDAAEDETAQPFDVETDIDAIFDDIDDDEANGESQDDDEAAFTFGPGEDEQAGETPTPEDLRAGGRGDHESAEAGPEDGLADPGPGSPGPGPGPDPGDPEDPGDDPLRALLADSDESAGADSASYLKETRRTVREAAERAAEGQAQRRTLTPKQRALLAAKIRRKRLAEQGLALAVETPAAQPPPVAAPARPHAGDAARKPKSVFAKATGALTALRARLPGPDVETATPAKNEAGAAGSGRVADAPPNITRSAREALTRAAPDLIRGKPIMLALGAAILLASAALIFLVKDLVSGAPDPVGGPKRIEAASPPESASEPPASEGEQPQAASVPQAPSAPLTQPRALYVESVAKLESAKTEAQTREALKLLQQAAALGHPPAQLQLGELYKLGQGVEQDAAQARLWYERAAEGGNVLAMHRVGVMSARGQGGPADQAAAIAWFEKAANFGLVDSQYNLGATYHPASDSAPNPVQNAGEAYFWYALAARNGDAQAKALADGLAANLSPDERRAIDRRVAEWKAESPDPDANEVAAAH